MATHVECEWILDPDDKLAPSMKSSFHNNRWGGDMGRTNFEIMTQLIFISVIEVLVLNLWMIYL
jgi:hypothetical protein